MAEFKDIMLILNDYTDEVKQQLKKNAVDVANQGMNKLRASSPIRTGDYKRGWRVQNDSTNKYVDVKIHNVEYRLTHLLEKGHKIVKNGVKVGRAKKQVHIKPVEEYCVETFEKKMEEAITKGR